MNGSSPYPLKQVLLGWIVVVPWQPDGVGALVFSNQQAANDHGRALHEAFLYGKQAGSRYVAPPRPSIETGRGMQTRPCQDCARIARGTTWRGSPPKCPKHRQNLPPRRRG
jgi:hypothetical protein